MKAIAETPCKVHGEGTRVFYKSKGWRCKTCESLYVTRKRRQIKATLVAERGGKCEHCGYDKSVGALTFHHRDPKTKLKTMGNWSYSLARAREEASKCDLLCMNCHAEEEERLRNSVDRVALS